MPATGGAGLAHWAGTFVLYTYLLPAIALLLFMCAALLRLFRLRAQAWPVADPVWRGALARAQSRMGFTKGTALLSGGDISSPISWGLIRPTILLNKEVLAASAQAEAIIAHELAHVIQHDWAKLILARIVTASFWFNPLAWLLAREAHQLREEAADDAVLAADIAGLDYAALLVGIARSESRGFLSVAHGVAPSRTSLRRRVMRVLDDRSVRVVPGRGWVAAWTAAMLVMAAPLAALSNVPPTPKISARLPVAASVRPQVRLDQLPQILRTNLDAECASKGGTPGPSPNLFATADLNGDGIADLVFDRKNYECRGATSPMDASRYGTTLTIFLGNAANRVTEVYTAPFYGSRVENNPGGKPFLTVATTADCDQPETCGRPVVLDAATHSFVLGTKTARK